MATLILPKISLLMVVLCLLLSKKNSNNHPITLNTVPLHSFSHGPISLSVKNKNDDSSSRSLLQYDFYRNSCPHAERIVRAAIHHLYRTTPTLVPAIIRLAFHDCFVQGCDASVLLDDDDYIDSEKESPPNANLKGFEVIQTIKSKLEEACPGVVSCADILVLAARDCVALSGGPCYPLRTGRRDGSNSFSDIATYELPSPYGELSQTLAAFKSRGFNEREMVTLQGAHSIGVFHCKFFQNRLYNFNGTNEPDPSLDTEFLNLLRSRCSSSNASSSSASSYTFHGSHSSLEEKGINIGFEQHRSEFGTLYYRSLLQGRGILYADQQLMEGKRTKNWVETYASHPTLFHRDFAQAMIKLSDLQVLTLPMGQIRLNCSKVA
ncbi:putative Peroxidase 48 [Abrus precatorius]|uniref:Peroxidase n=1 Tax=Abrus precatorius TaxID=3816 RepID=A0A8B8KM47_ABRPR|nr:putative Peroxidase 48 [Abrus precatorius]